MHKLSQNTYVRSIKRSKLVPAINKRFIYTRSDVI